MARKKSAAAVAGEYGQLPFLRLVFQKGPVSGEIRDFKPGKKVRIGRIATGNTVAIKDAGISSKHVVIQVEYVSDLGGMGWVITDLGSSNGTALNRRQLSPSVPALLSEGDVVEIGEQTTIGVKFGVQDGGRDSCPRNMSRNPKRRVRSHGIDLGVIHEESELNFSGSKLGTLEEKTACEAGNTGEETVLKKEGITLSRCRSTRLLKKTEFQSELPENATISATGKSRRRERLVEETNYVTKQGEQRRTRGSRKEQTVRGLDSVGIKMEGNNSSKEPEISMPEAGITETEKRPGDERAECEMKNGEDGLLEEIKKELGEVKLGQRRTRRSKKEQDLPHSDAVELKGETKSSKNAKSSTPAAGVAGCEEKNGKNGLLEEAVRDLGETKQTLRNSRRQVDGVELKMGKKSSETAKAGGIPEDGNAHLVKSASNEKSYSAVRNGMDGTIEETHRHMGERKVGGRRGRTSKKQVFKDLDSVQQRKILKTANRSTAETQMIEEVERSCDIRKDDSRKEQVLPHSGGVEIKREAKNLLDLEKMTLGEWIGYLEEFLPQQIICQTEKMISDMKHRREKLNDFLLHHENGCG